MLQGFFKLILREDILGEGENAEALLILQGEHGLLGIAPYGIYLVPEKFHPYGVRRIRPEEIEDTAPHGKLPPRLGALLTGVAQPYEHSRRFRQIKAVPYFIEGIIKGIYTGKGFAKGENARKDYPRPSLAEGKEGLQAANGGFPGIAVGIGEVKAFGGVCQNGEIFFQRILLGIFRGESFVYILRKFVAKTAGFVIVGAHKQHLAVPLGGKVAGVHKLTRLPGSGDKQTIGVRSRLEIVKNA